MPLSGHSSDLSLADLVQANAYGRNTCRVMVATDEGNGVFFLANGAVVDAALGNLSGKDAFCALVNAENAHFQVDSGLRAPSRTINEDWQKLLLDAMELRDQGRVPRPHLAPQQSLPGRPADAIDRRLSELLGVAPNNRAPAAAATPPAATVAAMPASLAASVVATGVQPAPAVVPGPSATPASVPQTRTAARRPWRLVAAAVAVAAIAVVAFLAASHKSGEAREPEAAAAAIETVESTALAGASDVQPQVLAGHTPHAPDGSLAVMPAVVCRILVDEHGAVVDARIFRSRLDLASWEDAALEAVKLYRFTPGQRAGRPVRVWINLPVSFQ